MGLFQRGSQAWLGPQELTSPPPHPRPSLLQGTAEAKASSGQDYVYWVDPWRERHDTDLG